MRRGEGLTSSKCANALLECGAGRGDGPEPDEWIGGRINRYTTGEKRGVGMADNGEVGIGSGEEQRALNIVHAAAEADDGGVRAGCRRRRAQMADV